MRLILAVGAALALSACATVTKGTEDSVNFDSAPQGAAVSIQDVSKKLTAVTCSTPCAVELNRKWAYNVSMTKEGFQPWTGLLEPKMSGDGAAGMAGNLLVGGLIGAAIDGSTGAMNDLKPNPMVATLTPVAAAAAAEAAPVEAAAEAKPAEAAPAAAAVDAAAPVVEAAAAAAETAAAAVEAK